MKKLLSITMMLLFAASAAFAQHTAKANADRKSPHETVTGKNISVTYGRPYKKGRDIFGGLAPYGKVWRTGADEATQVTLDKPSMFGGKQLSKGTYTLFVIPNEKSWTIILNKKLDQWGAFDYDKVKDQDVLHVDAPVKHLDNVVEQFTVTAKDNGLQMDWDKTSVMVPIKFQN